MLLALKNFLKKIPPSSKRIVIIEVYSQVASTKSSLLLKIIFPRTQTLQLLTMIIKTESIYKSNQNAKLKRLVDERPIGPIKRARKHERFKMRHFDYDREYFLGAN